MGRRHSVSMGMDRRRYFVYILASRNRALYVGITEDPHRRIAEHRAGAGSRFARKYRIERLVYLESYDFVGNALCREKQLKGWSRAKKIALIEIANPSWDDLSDLSSRA